MRTRILPIAALAAGALAIAGCGSDDNGDGGDSGGSASTTKQKAPSASGGGSVKLSATEFKFTPDNPSVDKGTAKFSVSNDGQAPHALEVEGPDGEKETPVIQPGKSATLSVDLSKDGTYEFYCPVGNHKQMGMEGEVKVGSGGAGGGSTSTSEGDDSGGGGGGY
jgi:uncharacterized cupredoxin-like copper-binding protein